MIRSSSVIYTITFFIRLGFQATQLLVSLHLYNLGTNLGTIGLLLGAAGIIPVLSAVLFGRITDRIGPHRLVLIGSTLSVLGYLMMASATSPLLVSFYLMVAWLGTFAVTLSFQSFIATNSETDDQVQPFAWLGASISLANILAPAITGIIADSIDFETIFRLSAAVSSLALLALPFMKRVEDHKWVLSSEDAGQETRKEDFLQNRTFLFTIGAVLLTGLLAGIRNTYLPLYLTSIGISVTGIGILLSIQASIGIAIQSKLGWIVGRYGPPHTVVLAFAFIIPALGVIPLIESYYLLIAPMILLGFSSGVLHPVTMAMAATSVPSRQRGTALGIRYTLLRLGNMGSPLLFGLIASIAGMPSTFTAAAAISFLGTLIGFLAINQGFITSGDNSP